MSAAAAAAPSGGNTRTRRYAPLVVMLVAALAGILLPNALNFPQANPNQVAEYAPVPAHDNTAPPGGNISSLGLGNGSSIGEGEGAVPPSPAAGGAGANPAQKQCVGNPPRQTEDPLSPPCVSYYNGDNGGATYNGVTRSEIRILVYDISGDCQEPTSQGTECSPANTYVDLGKPPAGNEYFRARVMRIMAAYFNYRYQTYGRYVHFWYYFGQSSFSSDAERADAAKNWSDLHPFAVTVIGQADPAPYLEYMAQQGALAFVASDFGLGQTADYFNTYAPLYWAYNSTVEHQAALFADQVCTMESGPVYFSGNPGDDGKKRVYGLITFNNNTDNVLAFGNDVKTALQQECGITITAHSFGQEGDCDAVDQSRDVPNESTSAGIANMKTNNVTTILVAGGAVCAETNAANAIGYVPEWILAGDGTGDQTLRAQGENQAEWAHSLTETMYTKRGPKEDDPCYQAAKEVDPNASDIDVLLWLCTFYPGIQQMFIAIQVAGPQLTPATINTGMHAIPDIASKDPRVPACFYNQQGEYTCVKDAQLEWWDSSGVDPEANASKNGCYREIQGGKRYLQGGWLHAEAWSLKTSSDPCTSQVTI